MSSCDEETAPEVTREADGGEVSTNKAILGDMDPETLEREVMLKLAKVDKAEELEAIYDAISLDVPTELRGKIKPLYKNLLRFLNSEDMESSDDEGLGFFLEVYSCLKSEVKSEEGVSASDKGVKTEFRSNGGSSVCGANLQKASQKKPLFDVQKLKDFKISGMIGGSEKKECRLTMQ